MASGDDAFGAGVSPPGLDLREDLTFERHDWNAQRAAWTAAVLILLAALAGVFGGGPASRAEARSEAAGVSLRYDRFVRHQAPAQLRLTVDAGAAPGSEDAEEVTVWLSNALLNAMKVEWISPEPVRVWSGASRTGLVFATPRTTGDVITATLRVRIDRIGVIRGEIGVEGRDGSVRIWQMAYP